MNRNSIRVRALNVGKIITQGQGEIMAIDVYSVQYMCVKMLNFYRKEHWLRKAGYKKEKLKKKTKVTCTYKH